jgi:capsular exopolysaccharide synthesis family protein
VASNLALSFADLRRRTLLIDADVRRGVLHRTLNTRRQPGLTDLLAGDISFEEALVASRHRGLDFIPSGTRMQDGPELLGQPQMRQLMEHVRSRYDVVIVDCPPFGAGVDPFILATLTGQLLLVLRTGSTNREMAGANLGMIDRLPVRVLGAVLNGIPRNQGVYRYYTYLPGYGVEAEPKGAVRPLAALAGVTGDAGKGPA